MKSDLTASFAAYRAKPKPAPELYGPSAPFPLGLNPTDGYLSNAETRREREHRLGKALLEGYELRPLDNRWLIDRRTALKRFRNKIAARAERAVDFADYQRKIFKASGGMNGH